MKIKTLRRELEGLCECFRSRLVFTEPQILNAQTIQRRREGRMNRQCGLELLDSLVSTTIFNRFQRFVVEVNCGLRRIVSRNYALGNRLTGFQTQANLNAVDLSYTAHVTGRVTGRAAVCDIHDLGGGLVHVTSINPHSEAAATE